MRFLTIALASVCLASPAQFGAKPPRVVMMPPPFPGNGRCLKELLAQPDQWQHTRKAIDAFGYWPALLNVHFADAEIRTLFTSMKAWKLPFAFEVPVVKPETPTAEASWQQFEGFMRRFEPLGAFVDAVSFDEPCYASKHLLSKPDDYAPRETAAYIAHVRKRFPKASVCDIEPYPALTVAQITAFVDAVQAECAKAGIFGLDTLRLDVDWSGMYGPLGGSWAEVRKIEDHCRKIGIRFSLICWASDFPALQTLKLTTDMTWYTGVFHTMSAYAAAGGKPDEFVVESWIHTPQHAVPESDITSFARSVLDLSKAVKSQQPAK